MCNWDLLLFGKLPHWNLNVNYHIDGTTFQISFRFQTVLISLWVSCKCVLKVVLKTFKRMLLLHHFDGIFRFLYWFFKGFFLNWSKNLWAEFEFLRKRALVRTPGLPLLDKRLTHDFQWENSLELKAASWPL